MPSREGNSKTITAAAAAAVVANHAFGWCVRLGGDGGGMYREFLKGEKH